MRQITWIEQYNRFHTGILLSYPDLVIGQIYKVSELKPIVLTHVLRKIDQFKVKISVQDASNLRVRYEGIQRGLDKDYDVFTFHHNDVINDTTFLIERIH